MRISGVVITFNEEEKLGKCLDSLKKVCEEIVVVDSFSTDRTVEIALSKGARVITQAFEGHIQQKNFAVTQAQFPFILSLDADESLSDELVQSLLWVKNNRMADGYIMNRLNRYCGQWIRHGSWYPDRKLRLWDKSKGEWSGINPHDKLCMTKGSTVEHLKGDILHDTIASIEEHEKQIQQFTDIASRQLVQSGRSLPGLLIYIKAGFKFLSDYFFRMGFLDGTKGFTLAKMNARYVRLKYQKANAFRLKSKS